MQFVIAVDPSSPSSHKEKEERVRLLRERQQDERQKKLEDLRKAQDEHQLLLKKQEVIG